MRLLEFPRIHRPSHVIQNVNDLMLEQQTFGDRMADRVATFVGSWRFILGQSFLLIIWIILNSLAIITKWDPYPFILMNLVLSTQAAFTAPIIMMSQNRQAQKDRIEAHNDFLIDQKAESEITLLLEQLHAQNEALKILHGEINTLRQEIKELR